MAEITIKLTEKMVFDRQHCYEDSDCSECSCCMANDECLFNFREERKVGKILVNDKYRLPMYECLGCNHPVMKYWKYCPNCGSNIEERKNE